MKIIFFNETDPNRIFFWANGLFFVIFFNFWVKLRPEEDPFINLTGGLFLATIFQACAFHSNKGF